MVRAGDAPRFRSPRRGAVARAGDARRFRSFSFRAAPGPGSALFQSEWRARIAFRVLLYAQAKSLMPLLLMAGQGAPSLVVDAPEQLALPGGAPPELIEAWPERVRQLGELRRSFASDAAAFLTWLPRQNSNIDVPALAQRGLRLPDPDPDDWQALFDEAMAVAHAPDLDALQAELPLWIHAARAMLQRSDGEDSVSLARALVAALPEQRDTLLAAWADVLTDVQRAQL